MGTAGPLGLAREILDDGSGDPFFVLNRSGGVAATRIPGLRPSACETGTSVCRMAPAAWHTCGAGWRPMRAVVPACMDPGG